MVSDENVCHMFQANFSNLQMSGHPSSKYTYIVWPIDTNFLGFISPPMFVEWDLSITSCRPEARDVHETFLAEAETEAF